MDGPRKRQPGYITRGGRCGLVWYRGILWQPEHDKVGGTREDQIRRENAVVMKRGEGATETFGGAVLCCAPPTSKDTDM